MASRASSPSNHGQMGHSKSNGALRASWSNVPIYQQQSSPKVKRFRRINLDMILGATSLTRSSKETNDAYLARVTHLHLQNKRIKLMEGLEQCTNLKVLYLYDNQIESIQNLGFASNLQYLYLQNNQIKELPLLTNPNLKKLYLEDNVIEIVGGLEEVNNLEELHIARQKLPIFQPLQFDNYSLHNLSRSLLVIDVSGNNIITLHPFVVLRALEKFFCIDNGVIDLNEIKSIVTLPNLKEAKFTNNPVSQFPKYRDFAIGISNRNFYKLDDIEIPRHQQEAMKGLMQHRQKLGVMNRLFTEQRRGNRISANNLLEESSSLSIHNNPIKHINQVQGYNSQDDAGYHYDDQDEER